MLPGIPRPLFRLLSLLPLCSLTVSAALAQSSDIVNVPAPQTPHEVPSELCGTCHQTIYDEWSQSMHAKSTALHDPIHNALYRRVIGDPTQEGVRKKGKYPICLNCHAPNAAIEQRTKLDAKPAFTEGVNCVFCHTVTSFKGVDAPEGKLRLGVAAYGISSTHLQAPSGKNYSTQPSRDPANPISKPFHPFPMQSGEAAVQKSNAACLGCHDQRNNFHGVPLCSTGDEITASGSNVNCQSCHMPTVDGHASHRMGGGHNHAMVRRAVSLTLEVESQRDRYDARVHLTNRLPHKFPTGAPFRNAFLQLRAFDANGEELWKNFDTHPMKDDKPAMLVLTLNDGEGNPSMPPTAKGILSDTRLAPGEERVLAYDIPKKDVAVIRAELLYNLLLPQLVVKLDSVLTPELKEAKVAAQDEVRF